MNKKIYRSSLDDTVATCWVSDYECPYCGDKLISSTRLRVCHNKKCTGDYAEVKGGYYLRPGEKERIEEDDGR